MNHPTDAVLARYAEGDATLDDATLWTIESHLDECAACRAQLGTSVPDATRALLDRVAVTLDARITAGPAPARRVLPGAAVQRRWLVRSLLPWLTMTVAVLGCAVVLSTASSSFPSLVLLLAPIAPLPGVAMAWSRKTDPAWELIASTPAGGLAMVLRRTLVVLGVVVPVLLAAGAGTGVSLALVLLPCLAFTAAALALGSRIGVHRAAIGLGVAWAIVALLPSVLTSSLPVVLHSGAAGAWALAAVALAAFAATRGDDFRRLTSGN